MAHHYSQAFAVLSEPFSVEGGTLTRTMKPRRAVRAQDTQTTTSHPRGLLAGGRPCVCHACGPLVCLSRACLSPVCDQASPRLQVVFSKYKEAVDEVERQLR